MGGIWRAVEKCAAEEVDAERGNVDLLERLRVEVDGPRVELEGPRGRGE